mmetsp:Transcript_310/g.740  ORF Transcript_310/g.740 Transcript_310/m.740 type:complete len:117 (-) Transcript_310:38-388(-)
MPTADSVTKDHREKDLTENFRRAIAKGNWTITPDAMIAYRATRFSGSQLFGCIKYSLTKSKTYSIVSCKNGLQRLSLDRVLIPDRPSPSGIKLGSGRFDRSVVHLIEHGGSIYMND